MNSSHQHYFEHSTSAMQGIIEDQIREAQERLTELEAERERAEEEGRYADAQKCLDLMRDFHIRQGKKLERSSREVNKQEKQVIQDKQRLELVTFTRLWDEKMVEYEEQSRSVVAFVRERQQQELEEEEEEIRQQLLARRPHFSKNVLHQRELLAKLVKQRKYLEAEEVQKRFRPFEEEEMEKFDRDREEQFIRKVDAVRQKQAAELSANKQRVQSGRAELQSQRKADFDRLLQHHQNILSDLDQRTRLHVSKTKEYIAKQIRSLQHSPSRGRADYHLTPRAVPPPAYMITPLVEPE